MVSRYLLAGALCALAYPSFAAESIPIVDAPPEASIADEPDYADRIDFAWGLALTSNYISSGQSLSDDQPALQGYAEIMSGIVYSGVWVSTIEDEPDSTEFDLYFGIRPEFGPLSLDINYTRYVYDETGDCCGEWIAKAALTVADPLTFNGEFSYDPQSKDRSATIGLAAGIGEKLEFSAEFERDLVTYDDNWNAGFKWQATDTVSLDLRYHDSDLYAERYVVTLAYDFSTAN